MNEEVITKLTYRGKLGAMKYDGNGNFTITVKGAELLKYLTENMESEIADLYDDVEVTVEMV